MVSNVQQDSVCTHARTGTRNSIRLLFGACALALQATLAHAQDSTPPPATTIQSEEIEPRIVGRAGTMWVGFSGFADRFFSVEETFPANYTAQIDICRFLTRRIAVRAGVVGTGQFGGDPDEEDEVQGGSGAPAIHAAGGVMYFFTPQSIVSPYLGAEYWAQLTQRADRDSGSVLGIAGVQASVSSRASFFVQGGYGMRINRGDDNEIVSRFVVQLGVRLRM